MNDTYAITTNRLTRWFGALPAVDHLDLAIPRGSLCALMGPNGAGKTTLIRILMKMQRPSLGDATIMGIPLAELNAHHFRRIGYVSENQQVPDWMTTDDLFGYCQRIYPEWDAVFARHLIDELDVPRNVRLKRCSRGQRMKALLISSIAFRPDLLVMDEPFSGLDPLTRDEFASGLLSVATEGNWSMLLSSHDVDDVERLVDRVAFLNRGKLVLHEECDQLRRSWRRIEVTLPEEREGREPLPEDWLGATIAGRRLRYIHRSYDAERNARELGERFGTGWEMTEHPLSLREAYVELARVWKSDERAKNGGGQDHE